MRQPYFALILLITSLRKTRKRQGGPGEMPGAWQCTLVACCKDKVKTSWLFSESKGKARAELRPARRQARLPHSRSLLLPGRER